MDSNQVSRDQTRIYCRSCKQWAWGNVGRWSRGPVVYENKEICCSECGQLFRLKMEIVEEEDDG